MTRSLAVLEFSLPGATPDQVPVAEQGTNMPGWNASTAYLRVLHSAMSVKGWHGGELSLSVANDAEPLPRRPLDLGVGRWR